MSNNFFIILHQDASYVSHMLSDGTSGLSRTLDLVQTLDIPIHKTFIIAVGDIAAPITSPMMSDTIPIIAIENNTAALIETLYTYSIKDSMTNDTLDEDRSTRGICITWADNMLQSPTLYTSVYDLHTTYKSHYAFAEGFPLGCSPEFFSYDGMIMLYDILQTQKSDIFTHPITRESIFLSLEIRINDFDIEALLSEHDMRALRLSFTADTRRNFLISKQVIEDGITEPQDIYAHYLKRPERFRGVPSYIYAQITSHTLPSLYTPDTLNKDFFDEPSVNIVSVDRWKSMLSKMQTFSPEATICLGARGEVGFHPQVNTILQSSTEHFSKVYVETTGRLWDAHKNALWWNETWVKNITWIVYVDAYETSTYEHIHQHPMKEVIDFINFLYQYVDKDTIYVQSTRMQENESELEQFMKHWTAEGVHPIIQKYNDYCGTLENRKEIDISPIKRHACYHLSRDLVVLLDGRVLMCSQACSSEYVLGDMNTQTIEEIWNKNDVYFKEHINKKYENICRSCDEYYTVNE